MSSTSATSNVILGGSGGGYAGYVGKAGRRRVSDVEDPDSFAGRRSFSPPHLLARLTQEDEVFLFMVKEPVRSILSKLMDLMAAAYQPPLVPVNEVAFVSGPLGYRDSLKDIKPSYPIKKERLLPKPILR